MNDEVMEDRLQRLMEYKGLSAAQLAEILDVQPSAISHLLSGRNKPSFDLLSKFVSKFNDLNPRWFLLGEGEPFRVEKTESSRQESLERTMASDPSSPVYEGLPFEPIDNTPTSIKRSNGNKIVSEIVFIYTDNSFKIFRKD